MCRSIPPLWHINCAGKNRTFAIGTSKDPALTAWLRRIIYPACYATLLRFQRAGNNVKVFYEKQVENIHWSKMSDLNCDSCSQSRRVTITPHSRYGAAGGIQTHDPYFRRPGLSGKCMSLHHCGIYRSCIFLQLLFYQR